jgi:hypothetical protein
MATLGFYFAGLSDEEANELRRRLNEIAAQLGYTAKAGPTTGQGNAAALLAAIVKGECEAKKTSKIQAASERLAAHFGRKTFEDRLADEMWQFLVPVADESLPYKAQQADLWLGAVRFALARLGHRWSIQQRDAFLRRHFGASADKLIKKHEADAAEWCEQLLASGLTAEQALSASIKLLEEERRRSDASPLN